MKSLTPAIQIGILTTKIAKFLFFLLLMRSTQQTNVSSGRGVKLGKKAFHFSLIFREVVANFFERLNKAVFFLVLFQSLFVLLNQTQRQNKGTNPWTRPGAMHFDNFAQTLRIT